MRNKEADGSSRRNRRAGFAGIIAVLGLGVGLGCVTFLSEVLSAPMGAMLSMTISTGSAWAMTALIASIRSPGLRKSIYAAVSSLVTATAAYYLLIAISGTRAGGYSMSVEGGSAVRIGLLGQLSSMAQAILFWVGLSIFTGAIVGLLNYVIAFNKPALAAIAAGLLVGILVGPAVYALSPFALDGVAARETAGVMAAFLLVAIGVLTPTAILALKRRPVKWLPLIAGSCVSSVVVIGVWRVVELVRVSL